MFYMAVKVRSVDSMLVERLHRPCETLSLPSLGSSFGETHLQWRYLQSWLEKYNVNIRTVEIGFKGVCSLTSCCGCSRLLLQKRTFFHSHTAQVL